MATYKIVTVLALQVLDEGVNVLILLLVLFYLLLGLGRRGGLLVKLATLDVGR